MFLSVLCELSIQWKVRNACVSFSLVDNAGEEIGCTSRWAGVKGTKERKRGKEREGQERRVNL